MTENRLVRVKSLHTGGTSDALDGIDGAVLQAREFCFVMPGDPAGSSCYVYEAVESGETPAFPDCITPAINAGDWRWQLRAFWVAENLRPVANLAADHSVSGIISSQQVGENVAFGDQLYRKADSKLWKADKSSADTMPIVAMAAGTIIADAYGPVLEFGYARDDSWNWTLGGSAGLIYASTAGALTQTRPTTGKVQLVAIATHADRLFFAPQAMEPDAVVIPGTIGISIGGGGSAIETGVKGYVAIPYDCTITGWHLTGSPSGSIVIDVWKAVGAIPTVAGTIAGTEKPTLSSAQVASDADLTTWTTAVSAGDVIGFNVDSCSLVERATLVLSITK